MTRLKLIFTYLCLDRKHAGDWFKRFIKHPLYHIRLYNKCATDSLKYKNMQEKYGNELAYLRFQANGLED